MARNRMIKPEFFEDIKLSNMSIESNYLFAGLWVYSDDNGVYNFSIRSILGDVFKHRQNVDEKKVQKWVNELIENEVIIRVDYCDTPYLIIRNWEKHQNVPNPSKRSNLSKNTVNEIKDLYDTTETQNRVYLEPNESLIRLYFCKEKEKEKEKEKKKGHTSENFLEKKTTKFNPPTIEEWSKFCEQKGYLKIAQKSYDYYAVNNWLDGNGKALKSWKQKLISVWFRDDNLDNRPKPKGVIN